jgi:WD40 repeat protein
LEYARGDIVATEASARAILKTIEAEAKYGVSEDDDVEYVHDIKLYGGDASKSVAGSIPIGSCKWLIRLSKDFWVSDNTADSHEMRLWDCRTGRCKTLLTMDKPIRAMAPLSNGMIAVGLSDTNIRIVDPRTTITGLILNHGAYIQGIEQLANGTLASFGSGGVKLWR